MKYKTKSVEIEAIQWTGNNTQEILTFVSTKILEVEEDFLGTEIVIRTLEGNMHASKNDYIIKGLKGEFYPCKPDIFEMKYELLTP